MIRPEAPGDAVAMQHVTMLAFDRPQEADLVNALRRHGGLTISLVDLQDGRNAGHMGLWLPGCSRMKGACPCHTSSSSIPLKSPRAGTKR